ncbi:MAG: GTP-binding protein [Melioribacteraceae bacterium]|nr:GTP-binding protein [Melioribacteraceae bacterium]
MKERMDVVIVGHVDHGKSTLVGRLLTDTGSLPEGKLDAVKKLCIRNAKPFEYAFLLDALKDEQSQGITIDTARIFFTSAKREYIIIDAPGHIDFLKNMISGAARAEAAILLIDADEGIAENSRRHAYMLSLLGIKQIAVVINKMDLCEYSEEVYNKIKTDFGKYLKGIGIESKAYIPASARNGINLIDISEKTSWYNGVSLLNVMDSFTKEKSLKEKPLRMYLQGIYKFQGDKNKRRIYAGSISSGELKVNDVIGFLPSNKKTTIKSIEVFNRTGIETAVSGNAIGLTLDEELYVTETDLIYKVDEEKPLLSDRFLANIFWMDSEPLRTAKEYKFKMGTQNISASIEKIESVLHTSELTSNTDASLVKKHEAAKCIIKTRRKIPFDLVNQNVNTSRFVLVDNCNIVGGGLIIENLYENNRKKEYSNFELEFNQLVRKHFPHWEAKSLEGEINEQGSFI